MKIGSIIFLIVVISCNNVQNNNSSSNDSEISVIDSNKIPSTVVDTDFTSDSDTSITIKFPKDSSSITITGKLQGINKPLSVYIPVTTGKVLSASILTEDSLANIRINQIFTPDDKADGPFGKELKRKIEQQGTYKLIIGENLMQGEEWKGKFKLTVRVE